MNTPTRTPTFGQVLEVLKDTIKRETRVAIPGQVQSYDVTTQTADVLPLVDDLVQQEDGTYKALPFQPCTHVPVAFPAGGRFRLTFPINPGDTGLLVFCDRSLDAWQQLGGHQSPVEQRRHHLADAVFFPGMHADTGTFGTAGEASATLGSDDGPQIVLRETGIEIGGTDGSPPIDAMVKGTTYRLAEDTLFTALGVALSGAGAALVTAGTDPTLSAIASTAAASLATAGAALNAFAAALTTFTLTEATYLSLVAKVQ